MMHVKTPVSHEINHPSFLEQLLARSAMFGHLQIAWVILQIAWVILQLAWVILHIAWVILDSMGNRIDICFPIIDTHLSRRTKF